MNFDKLNNIKAKSSHLISLEELQNKYQNIFPSYKDKGATETKLIKNHATKWFDETFIELCRTVGIDGFLELGAAGAETSRFFSKLGVQSVAIEANPFTYERFTKSAIREGCSP